MAAPVAALGRAGTAPVDRVAVLAGSRSEHTVHIGRDLLDSVPARLRELMGASTRYVVLTDDTVWRLYGARMLVAFESAGLPSPLVKTVTPGEASKSRAVKAQVEDWMQRHGCHRDTCVVAFGGGVVGDLAGFVAATYNRGVPVAQVPTTLLAMIDSSIGGKTGIDTPGGKNLVGAFHQPCAVYADLSLLQSLPRREFVAGLAEAIKVGLTREPVLFEVLENSSADVLARDAAMVAQVVSACVRIKAQIVSQDALEASGLRSVLNFGHTVGHGVEAVSAEFYARRGRGSGVARDDGTAGASAAAGAGAAGSGSGSGDASNSSLLHGEAVSIGMVAEAEASRAMGHCQTGVPMRLIRCLEAYGLPTRPPAQLHPADIVAVMRRDKKNTASAGDASAGASGADATTRSTVAGSVSCVLVTRVGQVASDPYVRKVPCRLLNRIICPAVAVTGFPPLSGRGHRRGASGSSAADASGASSSGGTGRRDGHGASYVARPPGSKSLSNRVLLLAALSRGVCAVRNLLLSDDTRVMLDALERMGVSCVWRHAYPKATLVVTGRDGALAWPSRTGDGMGGSADDASSTPSTSTTPASSARAAAAAASARAAGPSGVTPDDVVIHLRNSGTSSRFLTAVCCLLPRTRGSRVVLTGDARLCERPIGPLVDALRPTLAEGATIDYIGTEGSFPIAITGGGLRGGRISLAAKVSSQFASAILLAAPFAAEPVELVLEESEPTSLPYIDMTVSVMHSFGVRVDRLAVNHFRVPTGGYEAAATFLIEPDATSATYAMAVAAACGRKVVVEGLGSDSLQGEARFAGVLEAMGCEVTRDTVQTSVQGPVDAPLRGVSVNMADLTDSFMSLAAIAAVAHGVTRISGVANQRVKESNRIEAMVTELRRCGVEVEEAEDGLVIVGAGVTPSGRVHIESPEASPAMVYGSDGAFDSDGEGGAGASGGGVPGGVTSSGGAIVAGGGRVAPSLAHGARVLCYEDHRIAMSFAVLACALACRRDHTLSMQGGPGRRTAASDTSDSGDARDAGASAERGSDGARGWRPIIVDDARCVGKTYPEFWDDMEQCFGVELDGHPGGAALEAAAASASSGAGGGGSGAGLGGTMAVSSGATAAAEGVGVSAGAAAAAAALAAGVRGAERSASPEPLLDAPFVDAPVSDVDAHAGTPTGAVVVIGMRGVGKSFLAAAAATEFGWTLVDVDAVLQAGGRSCSDIVREDGWEAFRRLELTALADTLRNSPRRRCIVACGGGVVETPEARELLTRHAARGGPVVFVERAIEDIEAELYPATAAAEVTAGAGATATAGATAGAAAARGDGDAGAGETGDGHRPALPGGESLRAAWARRKPLYLSVCSHQFYVLPGDSEWAHIVADFNRFLEGIGTVSADADAAGVVAGAGAAAGGTAAASKAAAPPAPPAAPQHSSARAEGLPRYLSRLPESPGTFFVCLTLEDLRGAEARHLVVDKLTEGADAIELRVDRLASLDREYVLAQLAVLRREAPYTPVIFTVRSVGQGGSFAGSESHYFDLLRLGVSAGVAYVDVECCWSEAATLSLLLNKRSARAIGSYHFRGSRLPHPAHVKAAVRACHCGGHAAIAKVVCPASSGEDGVSLRLLADDAAAAIAAEAGFTSGPRPVIAVCTGEHGRLSRVLNRVLTPVTHDDLPVAAAPGMLTASDIQQMRVDLGFLRTRRYSLFGHPIAGSPSPIMHSAGFRLLNLPHTYDLVDTNDISTVLSVLRQPSRGGASITMPHKRTIVNHMDAMGPAAAAIGAVNTVTCDHGRLIGHNTDWIGIRDPLTAKLRERDRRRRALFAGGAPGAGSGAGAGMGVGDAPSATGVALILGGGGTAWAAAYALRQMGLPFFIHNRSLSKAVDIARRFGGVAIRDLDGDALSSEGDDDDEHSSGGGGDDKTGDDGGDGGGDGDGDGDSTSAVGAGLGPVLPAGGKGKVMRQSLPADVEVVAIVSTVPPEARIEVPDVLLDSDPVVVEAAYRPRTTLLVAQARARDCLVVEGIEMLIAQGVAQFELWTQRPAPVHKMSAITHDFYDRSPVSTDTTPLLAPRQHEEELSGLTRSLGEVDTQLVKLLSARMSLAQQLAKVNDVMGSRPAYALFDLESERVRVERMRDALGGALPATTALSVFRELNSAALSMRTTVSVAYTGPVASTSHTAALSHFGRASRLEAAESVSAVFAAVARGANDFGVVAVENSRAGAVRATMEHLTLYAHSVRIVGERAVPVTFSLLAPAGVATPEVRVVVGTHAVMEYCRRYLRTRFRRVEQRTAASVADAVEVIRNTRGAAMLAPALAAEVFDLAILETSVEDVVGVAAGAGARSGPGVTRFLVLARGSAESLHGAGEGEGGDGGAGAGGGGGGDDDGGEGSSALSGDVDDNDTGTAPGAGAGAGAGGGAPAKKYKTSVVFALEDRPGSLHAAMGIFTANSVNLSKIESRPASHSGAKATFSYHFFVDLDGHTRQRNVQRCLRELRKTCAALTVLGSYAADDGTVGGGGTVM